MEYKISDRLIRYQICLADTNGTAILQFRNSWSCSS